MGNELATIDISSKIYTLRGQQVMLDRDLAMLYGVETRVLKQAIKRNQKRFPPDFMFKLDEDEIIGMVSQNVIPSKQHLGGSLPIAFTEQGVASLSSILNNDLAIEMNIQIMRAFVAMRRFIASNAQVFQKVTEVERRQIAYEVQTDKKFEEVFSAIEDKGIKPEKGIFFDGQVFDAYTFVADIIRSAKDSIILIDNYVDDSVLTLLSKRNKDVNVTIYTKEISKQLSLDVKKHNSQYQPIQLKEFKSSHDRFMVIDGKEVYHFGASLKDLGKKWFAFSRFEKEALALVGRLG